MKKSMGIMALLLAAMMVFATSFHTQAKGLTVNKAIQCFVKSLKTEAFSPAWFDGGKKEFMKTVKNNENYPVVGDVLSKLVNQYLADAVFKNSYEKNRLVAETAKANKEQTVAASLWDLQQQVNPSYISDKGKKMMAKYEGELKALASM